MSVCGALWLAVWAAVAAVVRSCPQPCSCMDKAVQNLVNCAYKDLEEVPTGLPPNITTLNLSANKIKLLKSKSFINVTQVNSLWLAHNEIVTIERDTLAPMIQLKNLDISHNKIVFFPWEDLHNLTALQLIKLNNNEMVSLPKDAFSTLVDLRSLRINHNKFTTIVEGTFSSLSLSHLQIFNNPFSCTCALEWLRDWIATTKISVPDSKNIVCDSPANLKGTMVSAMPKLTCKAPVISVTYQPDLESTELSEGAVVVLHCEAQGIPLPQLVWEVTAASQKYQFPLPSNGVVNDKPINDKTTNGQFHVFQNGTLAIPRMSKKVEGNYSCSATNEIGRAQSTVQVALASQKYITKPPPDSVDKLPAVSKPASSKVSKNNEINWSKTDEKTKDNDAASEKHQVEQSGAKPKEPMFGSKCGVRDGSEYISNHAFNMTLDDLKQYTFDFGVIALEVSETEAKVQLNPLQLPNTKTNLHLSPNDHLDTINKEQIRVFESSSAKTTLDMLYLCVDTGNGHTMVQWSKIEDGVNSYRFHHLQPGTNYTLCLTYGGQDCQVQVVFTTRKKIPSLLIIVVVSVFLLALATVPLLGATCCHLLYKYQGKTYKLIMKAQNPDQMEKQMAADFNPRASFVGSEKNFNPSELEEEGDEGEQEDADREGEAEGSVVTESIPGSSSKTNPEEFEVGSEYSDRLPLGAEAVTISEEINGNYKEPSR